MKYKLVQENHTIAGSSFIIERVENLDDLVDEISDDLFNEDERLPYWAELWPSARALTAYIVNNAQLFKGKTILELGCGMGLTTMALAQTEKKKLLATDYEQEALDATARNCRLNGINIVPELALLDWRIPDLKEKYDLIVASDVAYEQRFFEPLANLFRQYIKEGGTIVLAEPNRSVARPFFGKLRLSGFKFSAEDFYIKQDKNEIKVTIYNMKLMD